MKILIEGGRLIDPANSLDGRYDIVIEKRKVLELITKQHSANNFYDDNIETINYVKDIPNLFAYFVE